MSMHRVAFSGQMRGPQSRCSTSCSARSVDNGSFHHKFRSSRALLASNGTPDRSSTRPFSANLGLASAGSTSIASTETPPLSQAHAKPTLNQYLSSDEQHVMGAEQRSAIAGLWPCSTASRRSINDLISDAPRRLVLLHTALSPHTMSSPGSP